MNIYRVVISFIRSRMHYQQERGAFAMTPGQAVDGVFSALEINRSQISDLKIFVEIPSSLEAFHPDTQNMGCVGSDLSVRDLWKARNRA